MTKLYMTEISFIIIVLPNTMQNIQLMSDIINLFHQFIKKIGINSTDYNLIIIGKYPTSFLSQGQVNFGE
ncbi:hypothetical protein EJD97_021587 [Solanum chilense]|uniref:Uncharacterized protein n=1 Tax=Solanum chilense TaxID=4083 RepID=A0A6N2ACU5_SOLCI|nr:hypothetical protein EJD97_024117 [Solanum chilense]TMW86313.1 hypothetical protein EJD97_021587 [Solanum chilense]